jgi:hypothetical protein
MDRSYLLEHASDRFNELKYELNALNPETFFFIEEFVIDLVCCNGELWVKILDEEHDHTDSYFLEAQLQQVADNQGALLCFVDALDSIEQNLELILQKVDDLKNNKN